MLNLQVVLAQARREGVLFLYKGEDTVIDGLRWDLWAKYKDTEVTTFRGRQVIKEK